jgi:CubicO group peptidase (beta-lactamase class C family)
MSHANNLRLFTGLLLAGSAASYAQAPKIDQFAEARAEIQRQLATTGVASIAVAVAKDGKILWEEGFGMADREAKRPATANTMYSLASISKPFTATGLMTLVQQGKVNIDRPANDYLGTGKLTSLAGDARDATVKRVLSHTAGLPLHYQFFYANSPDHPPPMDVTIARYGNLVFAPGSTYEYSNLGFGIIDHIIERASGQPYGDYMRAHVFAPLGLTHTSVDVPQALEQFAAQRYDAHQRPIPFYTFDHRGASAVYSSAHDLVRFAMFHLKDRLADQHAILADSTIDRMHTAVAPANYGLGFDVGADMGVPRFAHTGGMPGVSTIMNLYPTENVAVVVLTGSGAQANRIAQDIAAALIPRYADSLAVRRATGGGGRGGAGRGNQPPLQVDRVGGTWVGTLRTWQGSVPFQISVAEDGAVTASLGGPPAPVSDAALQNDRLVGQFTGKMPNDDLARAPYKISMKLVLVNGTLRGEVTAIGADDAGVVYYALSGYGELKKSGVDSRVP